MSQNTPNTPPPVRRAQRPPRFNINNNAFPANGGSMAGSRPATAQAIYTGQTNNTMPGGGTGDQPYWPQYANPFAAGNFMVKGFEGFVDFTKSGMSFGEKFTYGLYDKFSKWSKKWFTHIFLAVVLALYSLGGALLFTTFEASYHSKHHKVVVYNQTKFFENMRAHLADIEKREYNEQMFHSQIDNLIQTEFKYADINKILNGNQTYNELLTEENPWTFWEAVFFCATIYTTIGYGHIAPKTTIGRMLSMAYAIIGIPMFLIVLADFGKLFTRCLKFIWAYVRRIYYTGTCRKIRKQQQVRDAMNGINTVYDMAIRRPSHFFGGGGDDTDIESQDAEPEKIPNTAGTGGISHPETPTTPYPETFVVDDDFNLPISVATFLLISYILIGTIVYANLEEEWSWVQAFYFVFISMSTIGFGDLVPENAFVKNCSIVYFIFGLALTSMFINVVQIKLSDSFKQATTKISATIGLVSEMGDGEGDGDIDENATGGSQIKTPSDIASIHNSRLGRIPEDETDANGTPKLISILRRPTSPTPNTPNVEGNKGDAEDVPPPLLPRRQIAIDPPVVEKMKKKGFFKK